MRLGNWTELFHFGNNVPTLCTPKPVVLIKSKRNKYTKVDRNYIANLHHLTNYRMNYRWMATVLCCVYEKLLHPRFCSWKLWIEGESCFKFQIPRLQCFHKQLPNAVRPLEWNRIWNFVFYTRTSIYFLVFCW